MAQLLRADRWLADVEGPELVGPPLSLRDMLDQVVSLNPEREALVSMHQSGIVGIPSNGPEDSLRPPLRYTFSGLRHEATSLAVALYAHGVRPGQPFVAFLYNCAEFAIALWAAAILNVPFVPLDPKRVADQSEVEHCLRVIKPAVLLADTSLIDVLQRIFIPDFSHSTLRIFTSAAESSTMGWLPLSEMLHEKDPTQTAPTLAAIDENPVNIDADIAFVVFTSGTTGLPKACPHTSRTLWAYCRGSLLVRQLLPDHKFLQHLPTSHIFGYVNMLGYWTAGASVVFPSKSFDAKDSLDALEAEQCTHMLAVPTVIKALVSHPEFSSGRAKSLLQIKLAGTVISTETVRICQDTTGLGLGVANTITGYGMSEGSPTLGWHHSTQPMVEDGLMAVGRPVPGARVRICKFGSHDCVPYNEVGELHVGGPAIISGYMSSEDDPFYDSDACHWLATGDQARMNESGAVFILGRYKDIIIRAGENLAPFKIESCISKMFPSITVRSSKVAPLWTLAKLEPQSQVVGVPDEIAGEAPAAVLHLPDGLVPDTMRIKAAVVDNLGLAYAPEMIVDLKDIGLQSFPMTISGKVKKHELRNLLLRHMKAQNLNSRLLTDSPNSTEGVLFEVLSFLLGQSPAILTREKAIPELLDSISIMRFIDEIGKRLHKDVTMRDVQEASSVTALAKRIDSDGELVEIAKTGPPEISRIIDDPSFKAQHQVQPILEKLGLTWADDVQEVYPMAGTMSFYLARGIPYSHQFTYVTKISHKHQLRSIIASSLKAWPTFRSLPAEYDPATYLWVVLKHNRRFLDIAISEHPDVENVTELAKLSILPRHILGQFPDSLLFHAVVANVKSTGTAGFVMLANHIAYDLLTLSHWRHNLELLLRSEPDIPRSPFKLFADTYYLYRNSLPAQHSAAFHLRLLKGLSGLRQAVWPPLGITFSLPDSTTSNQPAVDSKSLPIPNSVRDGELTHYLRVPAIPTIASHYGIAAPVLVRTAIALFNTIQTGQTHAIFGMVMAGRAWPFLSPEIANALPNPLNIAGPTFSTVTSVLQIDPEETVEDLLRRVAEDQKQLNKHQHCPLSMPAQLDEGDREVWMEARKQACNWRPKIWDAEPESGLELVKTDAYTGRDFNGYIWTCEMRDHETVRVQAQWKRGLFKEEEVEGFLVVVMRIIGALGQVEQWGKSVGEVRDAAKLEKCLV